MSANVPASAREVYLASLRPEEELAARRAAEKAGIPDTDPFWLLLIEVQRACREASRCTTELTRVVADAVARIEGAGSSGPACDDAFVSQIAPAVATALAQDDRVIEAVTTAVGAVEEDGLRAMRTLESAIRDFVRRRAAAPAASLVFAFSLGVASSGLGLWGTYHVALAYGQDLGYRAGFNDARTYDRSHP